MARKQKFCHVVFIRFIHGEIKYILHNIFHFFLLTVCDQAEDSETSDELSGVITMQLRSPEIDSSSNISEVDSRMVSVPSDDFDSRNSFFSLLRCLRLLAKTSSKSYD